jgi:hypothetical protein
MKAYEAAEFSNQLIQFHTKISIVTHSSISASLTAQIRLMRRLVLKALIAARAGVIPTPVATSIWLSYDDACE